MLLGDIIKNFRIKHEMSLQDFANLINTSRSYIHMLEKNYNPSTGKPINPNIETLRAISNAMNISIEELLKQLDFDKYEYQTKPEFMENEINYLMTKCGTRLKESRENSNLSIELVSQKTGYPINALRRWESGSNYDMSNDEINKLADLYKVNPIWLRGIDLPSEQNTLNLPLNNFINDSKTLELLNNFNKLNNLGKNKAIENIKDLAEIPKYTENNME